MSHWVSAWGQAHTELRFFTPGFSDNTMLVSVTGQQTGTALRLRFSNREGKTSYSICEGMVRIDEGEEHALTFSGHSSVRVEAGQEIYSDEIKTPVQAGDLITIALAFSGKVMSGNGIEVPVIRASKKGNFVHAPQFDALMRGKSEAYHDTIRPIAALASIEVLADDKAGSLVCFGDSITQQSRWTGPLSRMLCGSGLGAINKGIGGNRMLSDPMFKGMGMYGRRALDRYDRDVLDEAGVRAVILALGTNDLGMCRSPESRGGVTADMLMADNEEMTKKARTKGLKVYCATVTPRTGVFGWKPSHEAERQKLNQMIRTSSLFDGVIDFDKALRNPSHPQIMDMRLDSGDHLHPGVLGGKRMAEMAFEVIKKDLL